MSSLWHVMLVVALGLTSSTCFFVAGIYFQHSHAIRLLQELATQDPYAYYISPKIFDAVSQSNTNLDSMMRNYAIFAVSIFQHFQGGPKTSRATYYEIWFSWTGRCEDLQRLCALLRSSQSSRTLGLRAFAVV